MMKKTFIIYGILSLLSIACFAQKRTMTRGDNAFDSKTYSVAIKYYQDVIDKDESPSNVAYAHYKIAECYYNANNYEQAIPHYKRATDAGYEDATKTIYRHYGDMLMMIGDNTLARKMYQKQVSLYGDDDLTATKINACNFIDTAKTFETMYDITNVQEINSRYADFAPSRCWNKIIFTSSRFNSDSIIYTYTGDGFEDLYETNYTESQNTWAPVDRLKGYINSSYNDGSFTFDMKFQTAYFMQCNGKEGAEKNCNIYLSKYNEEKSSWEKPEPFQYYTTEYSSGHPSITPDGSTMYFVSDNPSGFGGTDIWICQREPNNSDKWGEPQNAGEILNTPGNEMFPYAESNSKLYFSSNGHPGYGGLDIFFSGKNETDFNTPKNLKPPFNSSADDFGFINLTDSIGLFSSNRIGGVGNDDIYLFKLREILVEVMGRVISASNKLPISDAIVVIKNNITEQTDTLITDKDGLYYYLAMKPNMDYKITAYKNNYLTPESKIVNTQGITHDLYLDSLHGFDMNFVMEKIEKGKEYEIRDIYYDLDKYALRPISIEELKKLVTILKNNPDICIQINSYTDERASTKYNQILSNNRAKAVVDYLTSQDISMQRLTWKGWGESNPIFKNAKKEEQHQANRRTTFNIINFDELQLLAKEEEHKNTIERLENNGKQAPHEVGIYFRLQIAASKTKNNTKIFNPIKAKFPNIPTYCSKEADGLYKYTIGSFGTFQETTAMKDKIDVLGYHSFIVAFENGTKIPINEALLKLQKIAENNKKK